MDAIAARDVVDLDDTDYSDEANAPVDRYEGRSLGDVSTLPQDRLSSLYNSRGAVGTSSNTSVQSVEWKPVVAGDGDEVGASLREVLEPEPKRQKPEIIDLTELDSDDDTGFTPLNTSRIDSRLPPQIRPQPPSSLFGWTAPQSTQTREIYPSKHTEDSDDEIEILSETRVSGPMQESPQLVWEKVSRAYEQKVEEWKMVHESMRNLGKAMDFMRTMANEVIGDAQLSAAHEAQVRSYTQQRVDLAAKDREIAREIGVLKEIRGKAHAAFMNWASENMPSFRDQYSDALAQSSRVNDHRGFTSNVYTQLHQTESQNIENLLKIVQEDEKEGMALTPPELTVQLLPHQRIGLSWLQRMEKSINKGGILSDDMGLGKTVQAIALMIANRSVIPRCQTNLVVAPVALLRQWQAEIMTKISEEYELKVLIYHQSDKVSNFSQLQKYDVVLISYGTLSSEMKKHYGKSLEAAGISKSANFLPDIDVETDTPSPFFGSSNAFYRVILDEAHLIKNKLTLASKSVALLSSTYRWCLSGTPMQNSIDELYPLMRFLRISPYSEERRFKHDISVPMKKGNRDVDDALVSKRAIQKLQVLLKATLLRRTKDSKIDGKPILTLPPKVIEECIIEMYPSERMFYQELENSSAAIAEKMLNKEANISYSNILALLLRLRQSCCHNYMVRAAEPDPTASYAKENWKHIYSSAAQFNRSVVTRINSEAESGVTCPFCYEEVTNDGVYFFGGCGHPICADCMPMYFEKFQEGQTEEQAGKRSAKCPTCRLVTKEDAAVDYDAFDAICNKRMDLAEFKKHIDKRVTVTLNERQERVHQLMDRNGGELEHSAKVDAAADLVRKIFVDYPDEKIIIFSQFTFLFDIMQMVLDADGISWLRYDGTMRSDQRNDCVTRFYSEPEKKVMLISLKAGNVGLTLTCASHVIMMDPFWNPYVEDQATDRAHRIGQNTEVHVYRLLVKDSVEDRILKLQEKKRELVGGALDEEGMKAVSRLGRREMGFLFNIQA
ncbi:unnamed protein product [Kuraishia capsulata CBS 1993]|uniref:Uncharacterized protein n=1 Tax=Kuraishia capsulata CBS 1993 TaxID=1382522 RepID=W6MS93_9ASCO|nr:uncharacterized protein KUCA_T00000651001 [Kuraishia capsulata CBS 1993]CDK24685.1 unnamed protein product [Kuraishia capsulata CBS 1993]